jgi:hypothetical protein
VGDHRVADAHRPAHELGLRHALRGSRLFDRRLYRFEARTGRLEGQEPVRVESVPPIRASWIPRSRSASATSAANRSARLWARSADPRTDQLVAVRVPRCGRGDPSAGGADAYSHRVGSPSAGTSTYRSTTCSVRTGMVEVPETYRASTGSTSSAAAGSWQRGAGTDQRVFHGPADRRGVHVGLCLTGPGRRDRPRHVVPGSGGPAEGRARCTGHDRLPTAGAGQGSAGCQVGVCDAVGSRVGAAAPFSGPAGVGCWAASGCWTVFDRISATTVRTPGGTVVTTGSLRSCFSRL